MILNIIDEVQHAVAQWITLADQVGIRENTAMAINEIIVTNSVQI